MHPPPSPFQYAMRSASMRPSAIREILKTTAAPEVISFAGGLPAPELFPVEDLDRAARGVLAEDGPAALQYGVTEGHPPLRQWICGHLAKEAGLRVSPDSVLVTSGSQQGLDLVAKTLIDPGDVVLVENPAYLGALQAFRSYQATVMGVPGDEQGMRTDELAGILGGLSRPPKLLYLIPNFQNPTGTSLSAARRSEIVGMASANGVPVLEDDPYGRLRYSGAELPALSAHPGEGAAIYLGTSSKILAPGLRVAWLVCRDRKFFERVVAAKQAADLHTSAFTQRVVCRYLLNPGALEAHIGRLKRAYARRRDAMLDALGCHLPAGCEWTRPDGGLFLWVRLPPALDAADLMKAAARLNVAFVPGEPFWVGSPARNTLRLNFSNATEERIEEGVRRLGAAIGEKLG